MLVYVVVGYRYKYDIHTCWIRSICISVYVHATATWYDSSILYQRNNEICKLRAIADDKILRGLNSYFPSFFGEEKSSVFEHPTGLCIPAFQIRTLRIFWYRRWKQHIIYSLTFSHSISSKNCFSGVILVAKLTRLDHANQDTTSFDERLITGIHPGWLTSSGWWTIAVYSLFV